ncbi:IS110 family transposase [Kutzneria buriramensis]|uniref:IS110 family transposase n=1 Tax=Kutzneria buriramensis TaxID=1045776 RepID=UPI001FE8D9B1|nr:IS110 family transposase [Kutzneria buriramensis]
MPATGCGIDWAEARHDVAVVDEHGAVIAAERIGNDAAGLARLLEILAEHAPSVGELPVAIETSKGLLVAGLRAAGRRVFAINPLAVSRYRDRYRSSRGKTDAFDAMVLANIMRTDRDAHCPLPADSVEVQALQVLTRAQQDVVWDKTTLTNRIRSLLKAFFPAALVAFERGGQAPPGIGRVPDDPDRGLHTTSRSRPIGQAVGRVTQARWPSTRYRRRGPASPEGFPW